MPAAPSEPEAEIPTDARLSRTALVVGGSGVLGRPVCEALARRGFSVLATSRTRAWALPARSVPAHLDVRDAEAVRELVLRADVVVHLAAIVGNEACERDPTEAVAVNVRGALHVLEACRDVARPMIFASVSNVGDDRPYPITKATAERFCRMFARETGTRVLPLRIYNAYGVGQHESSGKLIARNVARSSRGEPLVCQDGTQVEDFIFADDVAFAVAEATTRLLEDASFPLEPIEVGTGTATTILEVLELIRRHGGERSTIVVEPRPPGAHARRLVATRTPFAPPEGFVPLEQGIARMFEALREGERPGAAGRDA